MSEASAENDATRSTPERATRDGQEKSTGAHDQRAVGADAVNRALGVFAVAAAGMARQGKAVDDQLAALNLFDFLGATAAQPVPSSVLEPCCSALALYSRPRRNRQFLLAPAHLIPSLVNLILEQQRPRVTMNAARTLANLACLAPEVHTTIQRSGAPARLGELVNGSNPQRLAPFPGAVAEAWRALVSLTASRSEVTSQALAAHGIFAAAFRGIARAGGQQDLQVFGLSARLADIGRESICGATLALRAADASVPELFTASATGDVDEGGDLYADEHAETAKRKDRLAKLHAAADGLIVTKEATARIKESATVLDWNKTSQTTTHVRAPGGGRAVTTATRNEVRQAAAKCLRETLAALTSLLLLSGCGTEGTSAGATPTTPVSVNWIEGVPESSKAAAHGATFVACAQVIANAAVFPSLRTEFVRKQGTSIVAHAATCLALTARRCAIDAVGHQANDTAAQTRDLTKGGDARVLTGFARARVPGETIGSAPNESLPASVVHVLTGTLLVLIPLMDGLASLTSQGADAQADALGNGVFALITEALTPKWTRAWKHLLRAQQDAAEKWRRTASRIDDRLSNSTVVQVFGEVFPIDAGPGADSFAPSSCLVDRSPQVAALRLVCNVLRSNNPAAAHAVRSGVVALVAAHFLTSVTNILEHDSTVTDFTICRLAARSLSEMARTGSDARRQVTTAGVLPAMLDLCTIDLEMAHGDPHKHPPSSRTLPPIASKCDQRTPAKAAAVDTGMLHNREAARAAVLACVEAARCVAILAQEPGLTAYEIDPNGLDAVSSSACLAALRTAHTVLSRCPSKVLGLATEAASLTWLQRSIQRLTFFVGPRTDTRRAVERGGRTMYGVRGEGGLGEWGDGAARSVALTADERELKETELSALERRSLADPLMGRVRGTDAVVLDMGSQRRKHNVPPLSLGRKRPSSSSQDPALPSIQDLQVRPEEFEGPWIETFQYALPQDSVLGVRELDH